MKNFIVNLNKLKYWLQNKDILFQHFQKYTLGKHDKRRIFINRNSPILFVAHLDTVKSPKFYRIKGDKVFASGLDDRLGAYIGYELSKELHCDLLLTDLEESCKSTAQYQKIKEYNWIVEFDRAGVDVVHYDLSSTKFDLCLSEYFQIEFGAFSDICFLKTDVCCVNIGTGIKHSHSDNSYFSISDCEYMVNTFLSFYEKYKDVQFKRDLNYLSQWDYDYQSYGSVKANEHTHCSYCGYLLGDKFFMDEGDIPVCESCHYYMYSGLYNKY